MRETEREGERERGRERERETERGRERQREKEREREGGERGEREGEGERPVKRCLVHTHTHKKKGCLYRVPVKIYRVLFYFSNSPRHCIVSLG